ncbi:MAG TPA: nitroreductase [Dictyobacter sp.]|jgi:nitroreductase|nr:nitroreductase [Dictyobacter sp.]
MTVFETIKHRRSIGKMTDQQPKREDIERMLEAATHAPNHRKVEPWRFVVLSGTARNELGDVMAAALAERLVDSDLPTKNAMIENERKKPLRAPVIITVIAEGPQNPRVLGNENYAATAAAVQNMQLTADELGLVTMWRTGDAAYDEKVKSYFGLQPEDSIASFLYVGYPAIPQTERNPQPIEQKTTWLGWVDKA